MVDKMDKISSWGKPAGSTKKDGKRSRLSAASNIVTVLLTAVIIAGGFMLPTLLLPYIDSYSYNQVQLASSSEDMVTGHVFQEPVTLYPWDIYDALLVRSLTGYESSVIEQSGIANFLLSNMELRQIPLESDSSWYIERIINNFRYLESPNENESGCFVLADEDLDSDGAPDIRCAVDFNGNLISLLFLSESWTNLQLVEPIAISQEQADEGNAEGQAVTGDQGAADGSSAGATGNNSAAGEAATTPNDTTEAQEDYFRPLPEEESIWLFSYAISREALLAGQNEVFTVFRQLELDFESRYHYPYATLIAETVVTEVLPETEEVSITTSPLDTGTYLFRINDYSDGTRLILYINPSTQDCVGFSLSTIPL